MHDDSRLAAASALNLSASPMDHSDFSNKFSRECFLWSSAICFYCLFHSPFLIYANYEDIAQIEFMA